MSFDDTNIFPEDISFGGEGGPGWLTEIVKTGGGLEYRNQPRSQQLCTFDVGHAARTVENFNRVARHYWACQGRYVPFRYLDPTDFNANDNEATSGFLQLTSTTFQAYKSYTYGATTYSRKIQKLFGTFASFGGTFASVDKNTGIVTMSSGTPVGWVSKFHVPVRYDIDRAAFRLIESHINNRILGWQSIPLQEIRL